MKRRFTPVVRLSLGLAALTITLVLGADILGIVPDQNKSALDARQKICEALALQLSWAALNNDRRAIEQTLNTVVAKNPDILSGSLQSRRTGTVAEVGDHAANWAPPDDGRSTPTSVQVPIFTDRGQWGSLQLAFEPLRPASRPSTWIQSTVALLLFVGVLGFFLFSMFLKRALRQLDPSRVVPAHVKAAFDTLAEGVLIMDESENIVLANKAFAYMIGHDAEELIGRKASSLGWLTPVKAGAETQAIDASFPWQLAIENGDIQAGVSLRLTTIDGRKRSLVVNSTPIADGDGSARGALATFDDVSELQENHSILQATLVDLATSKEQVNRQNKKLMFLASRDPLTHCLNRRALLEQFKKLFAEARVEEVPLSCAMLDIDHFKAFNDRYGHAAGDKVIKFVAKTLTSQSAKHYIISRYGGEEFFILMPGLTSDGAAEAAENMRRAIKDDFSDSFASSRNLTISIGVAALGGHADTMDDLLKRADDALYAAKDNGRDCVIQWSEELVKKPDNIADYDNASDDHDKSMLVQIIDEPTETLRVMTLNERVMELDAIIEEKSTEIHHKHGFDPLTGLPRRILFYDRIAQYLPAAERDGNSVAILYLDIDMQQRRGDALEPVTGDPILKAASERLAASLSNNTDMEPLLKQAEDHTMSRLGNNEFGIVLPDLVDTEAATWVVQRLVEWMDEPFEVGDNEIYVNCSIGISLYPSDGEDVETLVGRASQARHLAHANKGRHKYLFYAEDMNVRSYEQVLLESQLRNALDNDEFVVHYQPTYDLESGRIVGFEALLRWNNPEMGLVGPPLFMHIAEQTGLIVPIGEWVLRKACEQAKRWRDAGMGDLHMAVNLSTVQLRVDGLQHKVLKILEQTDLPPNLLELEVTETALMDNVATARIALQDLRARGVSIAMDDFGTGYSSLSHLKHLVVDKLKIDQSFVRDVTSDRRDAAVVSSIIAMSKLMGLKVTAEGVENEEQLAFLKKRRCDMAQGYLLSRPIPAQNCSELLLGQLETGDDTARVKILPMPDPSDKSQSAEQAEAVE